MSKRLHHLNSILEMGRGYTSHTALLSCKWTHVMQSSNFTVLSVLPTHEVLWVFNDSFSCKAILRIAV